MPRLPTMDDLGSRPVPVSRRGVASVRNAGVVADAVGGLGSQVAQIGEALVDKQDKMSYAKARSEWLSKKVALESDLSQDTDYATKAKRYEDGLAQITENTAASIGNRRYAEEFKTEIAPDIARGRASIAANVYTGMADQERASLNSTIETNHQAYIAASDPADRLRIVDSTIKLINTAADGGYIQRQEAEKLQTGTRETFAVDSVKILPPEKQIELLSATDGKQAGSWFGVIPIEKRHALLLDAETQVRAEQSRQRTEANLNRSAAREQINVFEKKLSDGVPVPDDQITQVQGIAKELGLDGEVYDLGKFGVWNRLNRESAAWKPQDFTDQINTISAKIAKAGDKPSPEEIIIRDHLVTLRDKRRGQISNDPLGFAASTGMDIKPVDWNDPASIQTRIGQANGIASQTGGRPQYLTPDEARVMQGHLANGVQGQLDVAKQLSRFGGRTAVEAAKQIAPNDTMFQRLVTLPESYRPAVVKGAEIRKGNGNILKPADDNAKTAIALQDAALDHALSAATGADINAIRETGRNIAATLISERGGTYTPALYWNTLNMALGAKGSGPNQKGGLALWNNNPYVLPDNITQAGFESAIARRKTSDPSLSPINPDGSPADLKRATPVAVGNGVYRFEMPSGAVVKARNGSAFVVTVRHR